MQGLCFSSRVTFLLKTNNLDLLKLLENSGQILKNLKNSKRVLMRLSSSHSSFQSHQLGVISMRNKLKTRDSQTLISRVLTGGIGRMES
jgi:hypothetical protein